MGKVLHTLKNPEALDSKPAPRPPNYPLLYPKYPLLSTIRAQLTGHWGVLAGFLGFGL